MNTLGFGNYAATDELGRTLPDFGQVPAPRMGKYVGLFYFLWLGQHGTKGPYDISKILSQAPDAVHDRDHPIWGPEKAFHFWGEPLYGYYLNDDAWVLRKHVQLLTNAGIDFLVFDTTNAIIYKNVYDALLSILDEVRLQGWKVPQIVFYTNSKTEQTIERIYEDLYRPGRYSELWFYWKGKPLIIGNPVGCPPKIREFFTFRLNQWPFEPVKTNGFPWIEFTRPQRVYYNDEGEKEVINVAVAQHPTVAMSNGPFYGFGVDWGRSFHNGSKDPSPDAFKWGFNIAEQWEFALAEDPQIVFITGWNEWIAMRLPSKDPQRPIRFVDQATLEFSRDIEPMKGGYNDSYYLQMIDYIRRFKGIGAQPSPSSELTIDIEGEFSQWAEVLPEYKDFENDTNPRHHAGYGNVTYTNENGRNDFQTMKIARDKDFLYFYARTVQPVTDYRDRNWMMLLLNTNGDGESGWHGFQYIVNRSVLNVGSTTVERSDGGWNWQAVGEARYRVEGNELHIAIPRAALGVEDCSKPMRIQFKWTDNMQRDGEMMDFYVNGDTAPDGRLSFVYAEEVGK